MVLRQGPAIEHCIVLRQRPAIEHCMVLRQRPAMGRCMVLRQGPATKHCTVLQHGPAIEHCMVLRQEPAIEHCMVLRQDQRLLGFTAGTVKHPSSSMLVSHGPSQQSSKEEQKPWKWVLPQDTTHLIQRPCYQRRSPCQDPAGNWTSRRPSDHRKETQTALVWTCLLFLRSGQNHLARQSEREKETT